ncbi:Ig-like domain-containing protein [Mucilaginibacter sp.]|uniref:gliding motility protein GldB-related protein n=1 Tax=Mucilaginibacter sp. TaxID=1882438 RepID=UPI0025D69C35|nr:Ig-like domain-containing protein [Mucilaginibacter sp.]
MKFFYIIAIAISFPVFVQAQQQPNTIVYTSDIDRFWTAFDSVRTTSDTAKQVQFIRQLYVDKGTEGLKAFMQARDYDAKLWVELINKYPKFWQSIKTNTLSVKGQVNLITSGVQTLKEMYPEMRPAKMYFTIGGLRSGGTTTGDMVLVGAEIATADKNTDASELGDWLKNVFKNQQSSNLVSLNIHEYVHTQQKGGSNTVLAQCIKEGAADFIAELVTKTPNNSAYAIYGREHEKELKQKFSIDMFSTATSLWLYNGSNSSHADLGYFIGYAICKAYYQQQSNKKQAIRNIIELDYSNEQQVVDFCNQSGYFKEPVNKQQSLAEFEKLQPSVLSIYPAINSQKNVPATLTELTFNFSEPMGKGVSISFGEGGKEHFPLTDVIGFADDMKSFKVKLSLQPGKSYNLKLTGKGFKSQNGYPLKEYRVQFEVQ